MRRGRIREKEGVAGRVTEKDCATDGDIESLGRREGEWGCGRGWEEGPRGWRAGARVREEGQQGRGRGWGGRPCYRGDFSHPRWPWLPQGVEEESVVLREAGG